MTRQWAKLPLRLRLALWSTALAGGALLGFALLSGWLIYQARLDRLDARMDRASPLVRDLAPSGPNPPNRPWERGNRGPVQLSDVALARDLGLPTASVGLLALDRSGAVVYQSPHWPGIPPQTWAKRLPAMPPGDSAGSLSRRPRPLLTWTGETGRWRVMVRSAPLGQLAIAVDLDALTQEMATLRRIYLITIPGLLLAIGGGAWAIAGQALRPVRQLSHSIDQVTAQGLGQRLPTASDPEFGPLIAAFNAMLERLERSFHQASRFSGDAAHELKTPLTILQGELEQAIHRGKPGSVNQQVLSRLLDQVSHLGGIVRKLLLLSLADAGQISLQREPVDLSALVLEQLEDLSLLAPDLSVSSAIEPGLVVGGDRDLLRQVVQNLITNAAKYNRPQGWVRATARRHRQQVQVSLANATEGLVAAEGDRLFDRFYRGQVARDRHTDGLGLGLSLARELVRAHGGDLTLDATVPNEVHLSLSLPAVPPPHPVRGDRLTEPGSPHESPNQPN